MPRINFGTAQADLPKDQIQQSYRYHRRSCPTASVQRCRKSPSWMASSGTHTNNLCHLGRYKLSERKHLAELHGKVKISADLQLAADKRLGAGETACVHCEPIGAVDLQCHFGC
jgi:hypothetical protein